MIAMGQIVKDAIRDRTPAAGNAHRHMLAGAGGRGSPHSPDRTVRVVTYGPRMGVGHHTARAGRLVW
ncbi:hypothetical protein Ait01nite_011550 [Actinoplanes italicus]|nr:hypothetical protein Ait01nite_011550 [Actinoplanes italicus]